MLKATVSVSSNYLASGVSSSVNWDDESYILEILEKGNELV